MSSLWIEINLVADALLHLMCDLDRVVTFSARPWPFSLWTSSTRWRSCCVRRPSRPCPRPRPRPPTATAVPSSGTPLPMWQTSRRRPYCLTCRPPMAIRHRWACELLHKETYKLLHIETVFCGKNFFLEWCSLADDAMLLAPCSGTSNNLPTQWVSKTRRQKCDKTNSGLMYCALCRAVSNDVWFWESEILTLFIVFGVIYRPARKYRR